MKKCLPLIFVCGLAFIVCLSACVGSGSTNADSKNASGVTSAATDELPPLAAKAPGEQGILPDSAAVMGLKAGRGAYTTYFFSPNENQELEISGSLRPGGDQNDKSRKAKIFLYEVGNNTCIDSYTLSQFIDETQLSHTFTNLDEDECYYLFVKNTTSKGIFTSKTIDGTLKIS